MGKFKEVPYRTYDHGDIEEEWWLHKRSNDWWYASGYLNDEGGNLYSFQYTMLRLYPKGLIPIYLLMLAMTDFQTKEHFYFQRFTPRSRDFTVESKLLQFGDYAKVVRDKDSMKIVVKTMKFSFDLQLDYGKGVIWHCNNGVVRKGVFKPKQFTTYYSWTNMPTKGTITVNGKTHRVSGKTWFDKEYGTFDMLNRGTHWEWFSLRFFDDEEIMMFHFPQSNFQDGTYITREGKAERLNIYTLTTLGFVEAMGCKFSSGWKVRFPDIKDEHYVITPIMKGQANLAYFEELCYVFDRNDKKVGMCFVELMPGCHNTHFPRTFSANVG